jgi:hypothetical protein
MRPGEAENLAISIPPTSTASTTATASTNQSATPSAVYATKTVEQAVSELCTDTERGLSTQDAEFRLKRYGK